MAHDREYFRRRAAEARSASFLRDDGEGSEVAGHLALAYAALARASAASAEAETSDPADPAAPLMLQD